MDSDQENLKLLSPVAARVPEKTARRIRAIGQSAGMSDGQVARLVLERAMELFKDWDPTINPRYFVSLFEVREEYLNLICSHREGFARLKR